MKKTIWGNTIVKNEGKFLWFALMSVVDFLDKILVWDTGSSDNTVAIINEVKKRKKGEIEFREIGEVDEIRFTYARQKMLDQSNCDWIFILDGDEVWWQSSIKAVIDTISKKGDELDLIVNSYINAVGDIYHYQDESAGQYHLAGRKGHLNVRAINRKLPGLHVDKPYGQEGYFDKDEKRIQDRDPRRIMFLDEPYLHLSNLPRSSQTKGDLAVMQRAKKTKPEIGIKFSSTFKYPNVFYDNWPKIVPNPWQKMPSNFKLKAFIETPVRKLKRKFFKNE